jgi:predicted  nucleic acid-binding Zn ribbon protein
MRVYPFDEIAQAVAEILDGTSTAESFLLLKAVAGGNPRIEIFQQFNCAACGVKQTIDDPNVLYTHGKCEDCGAVTNLRKYGCNYAVHFMGRR